MIRTTPHNRSNVGTGRPPAHSAASQHSPKRNNRGLTTLEWLLIVAAVAGLAALAVVLVQNVVDETAEQISGSSARLTAADVASAEISADADEIDDGGTAGKFDAGDSSIDDADAASARNSEFKAKCERLRITYGDALDNATPEQQVRWHTEDPVDSGFTKNGDSITVGTATSDDYSTPACVIYDV